MSRQIHFFVPGRPRPQGSKRHVGNGIMIESSKHLPSWRNQVASYASRAIGDVAAFDGAVIMSAMFEFRRPRSHFKKSGALTRRAPLFHCSQPDLSKLIRAVEDALVSGQALVDDRLIVAYGADTGKRYSDREGVTIDLCEVHR